MISPYVRRLRMAAKLHDLRVKAGLTHRQLSECSGESTIQISRLENAHLADQFSVMNIIEALGVGGDEWTRIMTITREAAEKGWWDSRREMGARQILHADLEAGAINIREYHRTYPPELLQAPEYTRIRWIVGKDLKLAESNADKFLLGMAIRQQMLHRPNAPAYEVIMDETVIRRPSAPDHIFREQLRHLAKMADDTPRFSLRVLPMDIPIPGHAVPWCSFSLFSYPDDPGIVTVESFPVDLTLNDPDDLARYEHLYMRVHEAAYPPAKSLDLITEAASRITKS